MLRRLIGALLVSAGLTACGSSIDTQTGTSGATGTSSQAGPATTSPFTSHRATHRSKKVHRPHEVPRNRMPRHAPRVAENTGGHLVQTDATITASDRLTPPVIALPSGVALRLTVHNDAKQARTVVIDGRHVRVPAGGSELMRVDLTQGTFPVTVDGHQRGHLTVGAAGGP